METTFWRPAWDNTMLYNENDKIWQWMSTMCYHVLQWHTMKQWIQWLWVQWVQCDNEYNVQWVQWNNEYND